MTDEVSCCGACGHPLHTTKADNRIEALTAKVKLMDDLDVINGEKIEALTAELAKAVELGDKMAKSIEGNYYTPGLVGEWRATLAEIEGKKG
jgi:hypothetical protein